MADSTNAALTRDAGMADSAISAGPEWRLYAIGFLYAHLTMNDTMHVDELWAAGLKAPGSPRALGSVLQHAARSGWMEKLTASNGYVARPSVRSNLQLKPVWRSLLYEHDGGVRAHAAGPGFYASCSCGWSADECESHAQAEAALDEHEAGQ